MSLVTVHGPNTMYAGVPGQGGSGVVTNAGGSATPDMSNGLKFTFQGAGDRAAADYDWSWTPTDAGDSPASPVLNNKGPVVVTFGTPGPKVVTLTLGSSGGTTPAPGPYVYNVTAASGPRSVEEGGAQQMSAEGNGNGAYYPSDHTVDEVKAEADANADDTAYIQSLLDAERADKNRSTLVAYLEGLLPYVPGDHTVADVVQYATDHPDELEAIIAAETANKNRSTLLSQLEALRTA